ncbi:energy transducer TonB [Pseudoxanthomonas sp. UTMC 1351]|uniref:energy transducer TonB n=1 Tax=Pseudoxanthomonas sp. UTMC 1351 TaxID=2695853 RepID=UPI0034CF62DD
MSAPSEHRDSHFVFRLPRHTLRLAAIAFGAGLLLFVLVWWLGRDKGFYKPEPVVAGPAATVEALPEPLTSRDGASGLEEQPAPESKSERPQLVEEKPMPPPPQVLAADTPTAPPADAAVAPGEVAVPIPGQTPPPRYPATAMRRGSTGTVLVRVEVGIDGTPTDVQVAKRSGSRDLDRAALEAVRDWRFRPGQRNGQPVTSVVTIPIDFSLER